ncbi:MAG TPA: MFS transporter [Symbiobacteriaceae bacterium]
MGINMGRSPLDGWLKPMAHRMAMLHAWRGTAAYPRMLWLLGVGCFLNTTGLSFLWPINSVYMHTELGRSLTTAGLVMFFHAGFGTLGQLAGGWLFDRVGARRVMLTGLLTAASVICLPAFFRNWPLYVAVMCLFGFAANLSVPAVNALAARVWPEGGRRAFNFLYVANNVGVALGTALGGFAAERSFGLAFVLTGLMLSLYAAFTYLFIRPPSEGRKAAHPPGGGLPQQGAGPHPHREEAVPWLPITALFVALLVLWVVYIQWTGPVAVHMQERGISLSAYSILWTLNGALIVAAQPLISLAVRRIRSYAAQMYAGTLLFVCSYLLMLGPDRYGLYVASMTLLTLGEMFLWPVVPAAVAQLSPPSRLGFFQGFIGSATTAGRMIGPVIGGLLYDHLPYRYLVAGMTGGLMVPAACFFLYGVTARHVRSQKV